MADIQDDIYKLIPEVFHRAMQHGTYPANMGTWDGQLYVSGRPGYALATLKMGGQVVETRTSKITPSIGLPVLLTRGYNDEFEAVEDPSETPAYFGNTDISANVGRHAPLHGRFGSDPLLLNSLQILLFLTRPQFTPDLTVYVEPFTYIDSNANRYAFTGGSLDLTSYVPGTSNQQRVVVVGYDIDAYALTAVAGSARTFGATPSAYEIPFTGNDANTVTLPDNVIPSAAVRLFNGQTTIQTQDVFYDMRTPFGAVNSNKATTIDSIITDRNGDIVAGRNGNLLYT